MGGLNVSTLVPGVPNITWVLPPGVTPTPENDPFYPYLTGAEYAAANGLKLAPTSPVAPKPAPINQRSVGGHVNARELWSQIIARMQAAEGEVTSMSDGTPALKKRQSSQGQQGPQVSPSQ